MSRETDENRSWSRRRYLAAIAGSQLALAGCADQTPPDDSEQRPESWEEAADRRIEKYRKGGLEVVVTDRNGNPVSDAEVAIEMQWHAYGFGTAVDAKHLVEETEPGDNYRTHIPWLFNKAVLENRHKWGFWEQPKQRRYAIDATNWLLQQGLEMRGHTCVWQRPNQGAIPPDVERALDQKQAGIVSRRATEHIETIISYYSDVSGVTEWDVLNEPVNFHAMTELINPDAPDLMPPELLSWYDRARSGDSDAELYVNEYNILPSDEHRDEYERLIRFLLDNGAPLDGIGLQAHHSSIQQRQTSTALLDTLDRFARLGVALQVTEYDNWGNNWTDQMEADYLYRFLKTIFSHPATEGFLMWGFWNGAHWKGNAPLFRKDWSSKPALDRYKNLVFDQWWTDESGTTNQSGLYSTNAFLGKHKITVRKGGVSKTAYQEIMDEQNVETVHVQLVK